MSVVFPTERQHLDGIIAFLTTVGAHPLDPGTMPKIRPNEYTEITVVRRRGGETRFGGSTGTRSVRFYTRYVSKNFDNAQTFADRSDALRDAVLAIPGGFTSTPVEFQTADPIGPDDGYWSGYAEWTYTVGPLHT